MLNDTTSHDAEMPAPGCLEISMSYDKLMLWSEHTSQLIRSYISSARLGPRTNHLLPVFGRIAQGKAGRPDIETVVLDAELVDDIPTRSFYRYLTATTGTFHEHLNASIPYFLEEQCRLGAAICEYGQRRSLSYGRPLRLWSLGSAEGPMARAVAARSAGSIEVICSSENVENFAALSASPEPHVECRVGAFHAVAGATADDDRATSLGRQDLIFEHTSFQMHHPDRLAPLLLLRRMLDDDGIVLLYEKVLDTDSGAYQRREKEKDEGFKARYFSPGEIQAKKDDILVDMEKCQAHLDDLLDACRMVFRDVCVIWRSGNFIGVAASNSTDNLTDLVALLPPPFIENSEYAAGLPTVVGRHPGPLHFRPSRGGDG